MAMAFDPMDVDQVSSPAYATFMDIEPASEALCHPCGASMDTHHPATWQCTLGLPEELLVLIMAYLKPVERYASSLVSKTWLRIALEAWKIPFGDVKPTLAFHALVNGKILRQCVPHVTWTVPDICDLPVNVDVYSPPFTQDHTLPMSKQHLTPTWRLKLRRLPVHTAPEHPDLLLCAELLKLPSSYGRESVHVHHYARAENPASYAWAEFQNGQAHVSPVTCGKGAKNELVILSSDLQQLTNPDRGFLVPNEENTVQFKVMLSRADVEHVAVFTEEDCITNHGPDLFKPTPNTIMLPMEPDWLKCSQAEAQRKLKRALQHARPNWDLTHKEFWRVIMRRNHSFRPVSKELRSYESPYYAVYAVDVHHHDPEAVCLFFKVFDGVSLRYVGKRFGGPIHTLRSILRDHDLNNFSLFEEVHSRRLDKIESVDISTTAMELGSGDVIVLCPRGLENELAQHYKNLVYTSNLVQIQPNMWHT